MAPPMTPIAIKAPIEAVAGTSSSTEAMSSMTPEPIRPHGSTPGTPTNRPRCAEDVDRFLGACELEEQRLQQDTGDHELQEPSDDELSSREVVHGGWMIPDAAGYSGWTPETRVNGGHPRP